MMKKTKPQTSLKKPANLFWLIGLLVCCMTTLGHASANPIIEQNKTITGTVVSAEDNMGIPGVNVIVKGTSIGAVTDFDGNYSITVPNNNSTLVFSYIGYVSQELNTGNKSTINVSLESDVSALDEVIVVGYGTAKKETLTGAIEQVDSEVFQDRAVTNVALALQGQSPGLVVNRNTARPGNENVNLQIRGATSVNGGSPLIVIDGAPAFDDNEFFQMNPDDIESISVLKDGAASIYGSRAANGVILVTTKKGKGKMKVEFNSMIRTNFIGLNPPVPTMQQYGQLWLDAGEQDTTPNYWNWTEDTVRGFAAGESRFYQTTPPGWGYDGLTYMAPANRLDELYGTNTGHQESLSLSGSSEQARYRLSMGLSESEGALKTAYDGIKQYSIRLNTDFDISEKLNLGANVSLQKNITSSPSSSFGQALLSQDAPVFPSKNPQGQWYANFGVGNTNSIAGTQDGGRDNTEENIVKVALNLNYDIGHGFSTNATATYNHVNSRQDLTMIEVPLYNWNGELENSINNNPSIETEHITKSYQTYGAFLNYEKNLDVHNFKAMVGLTAEKSEFQGLWAKRLGFVDEGVYDILVATGTQTNGGTGNNNTKGQEHEGLYSYLARINYDYSEKYLLEVVGRRDGSSRFAPGFKFNNYGSVSVGWNIHKESFLENFDVLNNLKVRASIGTSGNQVGIGPYDYVSTIGTGTELFGEGGTLSPTSYINGLTTTTRSWENVEMKNIGVDFSFFNSKLSGTFETYERKNNGMLVSVTYPEILGATAPETNSGNLLTTGWEAMLNWKDQKGDFSYNIGLNMSDSNNTLVNLEGGNAIQAGLRETVEGYPLNSYFVWKTDGLFQTQEEVDAYNAEYVGSGSEVPTGASAIRIGDTKKVDLDGNGVINDQNADNDKGQGDVKFAGDAQAHYTFGINLGAKYKGFDFTAFFQGHLEQTLIRSGVDAYPFFNPWPNQTIAYNGLTYTPENTGATYPRLTAQRNLARWNWGDTDVFAQNNKYIRLKTLVIGYSLPSDVLEKLNMTKIRVYMSGNDLFELSSLVDGFDPESAKTLAESDANTQRSVYPFQRTIAFGINLAF
ncbi:SusC/RagA family TonB-linked outer membrane protein [Algibacter sp. L4_22]|uniref:SusC/RagA family TonB-linked outer membrane protein n=1 Tax=Algibacter sp. L4_22 TaxID=2942477 RepID=UPI00201B7747|nr:SusC/RagA family TonB-linked outer membrane protein [Algibacter sp. L4_22]MCL5128553.1 SusC/RagA family TonB-linked outer membrane protein [Algibacter sp. L4_22]